MVEFIATILKFADQGEKTGWTYIDVAADLAQQLKPGNKKSFRVKGFLDAHPFRGAALMPMGDGNFIMALNADMRKGMGKRHGAMVQVRLELDADFKIEVPPDLQECFEAEPAASNFFYSLTQGHREYFVKWIDSAKTQPTRDKRIVLTVNAMLNQWDYGTMIRAQKQQKNLY